MTIYQKTIRTVLYAFALLLLALPMPVHAAPVEFYWGAPQRFSSSASGLLNSDFAIYDSDGIKKEWLAEPSQKANGVLHYDTAVSYDLVPGHYRWEGKVYMYGKDPVLASGYFEVNEDDGDQQRFFLARAKLSIGLKISPVVDSGVDAMDLYDYTGNLIHPYNVTNHYINGILDKSYLLIMRPHGLMYDAMDNPDDRGQSYMYGITPGVAGYAAYSGLLWWPIDKFMDDPAEAGDAAVTAVNKLRTLTKSIASYNAPAKLSVPLNVEVTKGAEAHVYRKDGLHFKKFYEYSCEGIDTSKDDCDIYKFDIPDGIALHCEVGGGEFTREMQVFEIRSGNSESFHIKFDLDELDSSYRDDTPATSREDSVYLNTDGSRFIEIKKGECVDLLPIRVQQAQTELIGNYFTEPDYHFRIIDGTTGAGQTLHSLAGGEVKNDSVSIAPCPDLDANARGREEYRITALDEGLSILKITYDAVRLRGSIGQAHSATRNSFYNKDFEEYYFDPIQEPKTAVVVINVVGDGYDSSILDTGITEDEDDAIYFDEEDGDVGFIFTPTVSAGGDISVRVHDPLHNHEWNSAWRDYGTKESGESFAVRLTDGRNIIEVKSGNIVKYHVVMASAAEITYKNVTKNNVWTRVNDVKVSPGDEMEVELAGLSMPVQKVAARYNPNATHAEYSINGEQLIAETSQYGLSEGVIIKFSIPDNGKAVLSGGRLYEVWWGVPWTTHRGIPRKGIPPMLGAVVNTSHPWHATLPDLVFEVKPDVPGKTPDEETKPTEPGPGDVSKPAMSDPPFTAIDPDVKTGDNAHGMTDDELADVKDSLPADKAEALDGATQTDESGALVSNPDAVADALPVDEKSEVNADASNMIPLPVFKTDVESGKTALVTIAVPLAKYADRFLSEVVVLKLKTDGATERLSSASSPAGISHAEYVWTDVDGAHIPGGSRIAANQLYYLSIAIKDNSPYDWDPALGSVVDPIALALVDTAGKPAEKPEEEKSDDEAASEAGSSGCDAGLGLAGLGLAVALASARRKSMNK